MAHFFKKKHVFQLASYLPSTQVVVVRLSPTTADALMYQPV